ncbi:uncharacterized protein F5Z01DRAFT_663009 [Emericellopsis atlantica]|uniref:Uncharacterized protein n=1 Tax=Emericellopsis atlantica TaxID=2614577 RepID=A0A9P8CLD7_9HYPO|nr:uncharacterized protein F5Z01DRAFT_663009 [Emericellopsis atlantica]KAG9251519.1 hypothetical protein F5Z01DRAFT_663009 [Emericellopsis atlantica]
MLSLVVVKQAVPALLVTTDVRSDACAGPLNGPECCASSLIVNTAALGGTRAQLNWSDHERLLCRVTGHDTLPSAIREEE